MRKRIGTGAIVFALATGALAQTTNGKYEVTFFGAPPHNSWDHPMSVAVDGKGSIVVFRTTEPPVLFFNRDGTLEKSWGNGAFAEGHSVDFDHEGFLWFSDRKGQMVYKYTADGKQVMALGKKGIAGDNSSKDAFNQPVDVAIARNGDIYVADGDGNSRVVHFSKDGTFISIIGGTKGSQPGQFDHPHALAIDSKDRLLVVDEQMDAHNARVQVFDRNGTFVEQWKLTGPWPTGIAIAADDSVYVADTEANAIMIWKNGKQVEVIGTLQSRPHQLALDPVTRILYMVDPVTPQTARLRPTNNPEAQEGFVKQVIPKK